MVMVMSDSSSNHTEVTFAFPTNGVMRGSRVVDHVVFPTPLTALLYLLTFGGRGRSSVDLSTLGLPLLQCIGESRC